MKGQLVKLKQCFDSFYDTDSPLSVTNIAEMALFYLNWLVLMIFSLRKGQLVERKWVRLRNGNDFPLMIFP